MKYALSLIIFLFSVNTALAQSCKVEDFRCVTQGLIAEAAKIENANWRDQTYREIAKTLADHNDFNEAVALIERIQNSDTKAMTIRGIGMEAAKDDLSSDALNALFVTLRGKAETIDHPPSYAIALTYIAMAQAFASDDDGAWKTASEMKNPALRNKAYGETAEIQAELGKYDAAIKSISMIDQESFRDKAHNVVSKILADGGYMQEALNSASSITNSYKKAQSVQHILDVQAKNAAAEALKKKEETEVLVPIEEGGDTP